MLNGEVLDHDLKQSSDVSSEELEKERHISVMKDRRESVTSVSADISDTLEPDLKNIQASSRENTSRV
jgi:hypothetical protein